MPKRSRGLQDKRVQVWRNWFNSVGWGTERDPRFTERLISTQIAQQALATSTRGQNNIGGFISDLDIELVVDRYEPVLFWLSASDIDWWPRRFYLLAQVDASPVNWIYATNWRLFIFFKGLPILLVWRYQDLRSVQTEGDSTLLFETKDNQKLYVLLRLGQRKGLFGLGGLGPKAFMSKLKEFAAELSSLAND